MMCPTNVEQASCPVGTLDEMWTALRAMSEEGLPPVHDASQAAALFEDRLLRRGIDLSNVRCRLLFGLAGPEYIQDRRLTAMRWAVDLHACVLRRPADPIEALEDGLRLVERYLRPLPGMMTYLNDRAKELAAQAIRLVRGEPVRLKPVLAHVLSMDDPHTVHLPFAVTLPVLEAFGALWDDGVALYRLGHRMGANPLYRTALLENRELIALGVAAGIYRLPEHPGFKSIEPIAYIEHFSGVFDDGKWIDAALVRLNAGDDVSEPPRIEIDASPWLTALSRLGGWTPVRLERLLTREDLFADHPNQFLSAAMNAIEHVARRDAAVEVWATLTLLHTVKDFANAKPSLAADDVLQQCRKWAAKLRRGHDILWLAEHLHQLSADSLPPSTQCERWPILNFRRLAGDRALTRGALIFLMGIQEQILFFKFIPVIEGLLSLRDEFQFLLRLARGDDKRLMRRAGMFMQRLLSDRI